MILSREFVENLEKVIDLEKKIERYSALEESLKNREKDKDGDGDEEKDSESLPGIYLLFLLGATILGGYIAYDFMRDSAWWWMAIVVLIAALFMMTIAMFIVQFDVSYRLKQFQKKRLKLLPQLAKLGSLEIAKVGMGTLDQISEKTMLGQIKRDQLKIFMNILVSSGLVEAINLNNDQILYKSLEQKAQPNIISEVITIDD